MCLWNLQETAPAIYWQDYTYTNIPARTANTQHQQTFRAVAFTQWKCVWEKKVILWVPTIGKGISENIFTSFKRVNIHRTDIWDRVCISELKTMERMVKYLQGGSWVPLKDLPQCSFAAHKSHMNWPRNELESKKRDVCTLATRPLHSLCRADWRKREV
jgi:hypothetical protein